MPSKSVARRVGKKTSKKRVAKPRLMLDEATIHAIAEQCALLMSGEFSGLAAEVADELELRGYPLPKLPPVSPRPTHDD